MAPSPLPCWLLNPVLPRGGGGSEKLTSGEVRRGRGKCTSRAWARLTNRNFFEERTENRDALAFRESEHAVRANLSGRICDSCFWTAIMGDPDPEVSDDLKYRNSKRIRTRANTNPNDTEASAAGSSVRACVARKSKS